MDTFCERLQARDEQAWTNLLQEQMGADVVVTAVTSHPLPQRTLKTVSHAIRYELLLTDHSDPITFIGKHTNQREALFFKRFAPQLPLLAPHCWLQEQTDNTNWLLLDDVPNHFSAHCWSEDTLNSAILDLANLHIQYWQDNTLQHTLPHFIDKAQKTYSWAQLKAEQAIYFEQGPAIPISEHALSNSGRLAPTLLKAANGLAVLRSLGGWPGILGESHLTAVADLLDDPVPMLQPLQDLPATLIHGNPHNEQWHFTLFDQERRLHGWETVCVGPGIYDIVAFTEQANLVYLDGDTSNILQSRIDMPTDIETLIDTYFLTMSAELGKQFPSREVRRAIWAARCLYVLVNWFTYFSTWFDDMPDKYAWQKINRMSDQQLAQNANHPIVAIRPYLKGVFARFLQAYRLL